MITTFNELRKGRERSRLIQLLMKLSPKFEIVRANIINKGVTNLVSIMRELFREETRLQTQTTMDVKNINMDILFLSCCNRSFSKPLNGDKSKIQCQFCG